MRMQRKRNIRLMIILAVLIAAAVIMMLSQPSKNRLDVDRDIFSYEDPSNIDAVIFERPSGADTLAFVNGLWQLNGRYKADPQRISVLFAILKQAKVRRRAARSQMDSLQSWMDRNAVHAEFYEGSDLVKDFEVAGDIGSGITFYRAEAGSPVYLMEIPGYRSYISGIFELDANGWRYPRVFDFNWGNLKDVSVIYPERESDGFDVSFKEGFFGVEQLQKTDTTLIADFLDDLSLLYVNDFLFESEVSDYDSLRDRVEARITVRDVGDRGYMMEVLETLPGKSEILIRIDSSEYALANFDALRRILRPRRYFREKEGL